MNYTMNLIQTTTLERYKGGQINRYSN